MFNAQKMFAGKSYNEMVMMYFIISFFFKEVLQSYSLT